MDDYVKRADVLALQTELRFPPIGVLKNYRCKHIDPVFVMTLPAADVVEVVRCKDCKHRILYKHYGEYICDLDTGDPYQLGRNAEDDNWFCADGERSEENG